MSKEGKKTGWFRRWQEHAAQFAAYGAHSLSKGVYKYIPEGKIKPIKKSVIGAHVEVESGADQSGRTTLTRVLGGAVIAGPVGAVVGGMFKKDETKVYATVTFADGEVAIIEAPAKDERELREFTERVNAAATD